MAVGTELAEGFMLLDGLSDCDGKVMIDGG
jgi:hypothetical protein